MDLLKAPIISCEQVGLLPNDQQCQFVKSQCGELPGFLNSFTLYYCLAQSESRRHWIGLLLIMILLLILFLTIGLVAGNCLVPNLNAITSHLGIPENISGLTILAFANGSPDIISTYTSFKTGNTMLALGEIIGAAYFINSVVIGTIFLMRPFDLVPFDSSLPRDSNEYKLKSFNAKASYIRDILFFAVSISFLLFCVRDGVLTRSEMLLLVTLYIVYVSTIIVWEWYYNKNMKRLETETFARSIYTNNTLPIVIDENVEFQDSFNYNPQVIRNLEFETILKGLTTMKFSGIKLHDSSHHYRDNSEEGDHSSGSGEIPSEFLPPTERSFLQNLFDYATLPFIKLFRHTIPILTVSDYDGDYKPGLSQLLELFTSLLISPFIIASVFFPNMSALTKCLLAVPFLANSSMIYYLIKSPAPSTLVKCVVSLIGVFASISWISIIASEIINILTLLSALTHIRPSAMGITVFAYGNSIGDLISCIVITRMGYPLMALAACIGGPLLNILIGLGMSGLMIGHEHIELTASLSIVFCLLGLLVNLVVVLLFIVPFSGWRFDKYIGIGMIALWFVGVVIAISMEIVFSY